MALACDCPHNLPACLSGSAGKYCGVLPYGSGRPRNTGECPHRVQGIRRQFPALGPSDRCAQGPRPPVLAHVRHRGPSRIKLGTGRPVPARPLHPGYGEALLRHLQLGEGCPRPRGVQSSGQAQGAAERRRHRRPRDQQCFATPTVSLQRDSTLTHSLLCIRLSTSKAQGQNAGSSNRPAPSHPGHAQLKWYLGGFYSHPVRLFEVRWREG